jgi:hypothetical protein
MKNQSVFQSLVKSHRLTSRRADAYVEEVHLLPDGVGGELLYDVHEDVLVLALEGGGETPRLVKQEANGGTAQGHQPGDWRIQLPTPDSITTLNIGFCKKHLVQLDL